MEMARQQARQWGPDPAEFPPGHPLRRAALERWVAAALADAVLDWRRWGWPVLPCRRAGGQLPPGWWAWVSDPHLWLLDDAGDVAVEDAVLILRHDLGRGLEPVWQARAWAAGPVFLVEWLPWWRPGRRLPTAVDWLTVLVSVPARRWTA